jgi:hypothetical protein
MLPIKIRAVRNRYSSAEEACRAWKARGTLWGNPIILGKETIHLYGLNLKSNNTVDIQFTKDHIIVLRRKHDPRRGGEDDRSAKDQSPAEASAN